MAMQIGIISDTHGLLRAEAMEALIGSNIIIHAGDIGDIKIIKALEAIAPVYAVRGNNDIGRWAEKLSSTIVIEQDNLYIYVIHDINEMDLDPKAAGFNVVISGHSHRFAKTIKDNVLYINPGGSGYKRFNLPLTVALLHINNGEKIVEIKYL